MLAHHDSLQDVAQVLEEMPAVGDLYRLRRSLAPAHGIVLPAIAAEDLDPHMLLEPGSQGFRRAIREQINRTMPLEIHKDRAVAPALALGPIIDAEHACRLGPGDGRAAEQADQVGGTCSHRQDAGQTCSQPRRRGQSQSQRGPASTCQCADIAVRPAWAAARRRCAACSGDCGRRTDERGDGGQPGPRNRGDPGRTGHSGCESVGSVGCRADNERSCLSGQAQGPVDPGRG